MAVAILNGSDWKHLENQIALAAASGFNNIPIGKGSVKIGKNYYQVHAEVGGSGQGEVHVQVVRGPDAGTKYTDPTALPGSVANNAEIQRRIQQAPERLRKLLQGRQ
ncbi:MAG TPA: hypothetical protein VJU87_00100 [Gemmatimonadaceae bacterium]|nr:hypothetical protein [Gemmatimonadaceae bacterium]